MHPLFALLCIVSVSVLGYLIGRADGAAKAAKRTAEDDPTLEADWWKRGDDPPY